MLATRINLAIDGDTIRINTLGKLVTRFTYKVVPTVLPGQEA